MSLCAKCQKPLTLDISDFSDDENDEDVNMSGEGSSSATATAQPQTVPDDVELCCGCHFHWQCLLDAYELETCPNCSSKIALTAAPSSLTPVRPRPEIRVNLNNEGGEQRAIDIFPILQEESYLRAYPEERKCRAFLEFCREGDHGAIVDVLKSVNDPESEDEDEVDVDAMQEASQPMTAKSIDEILRYQDPIGDMQSGLHAAAANGHREVAWLLLLLASEMPELEFPALVYQEAGSLGIMREDQSGKVDIRSLKDAHGRTAEDVAREAGVIWNGWIGNGRLAMP